LLDLTCDFEARDYCYKIQCDFFFDAVAAFSRHSAILASSVSDPELTIKLVNYILDKAHIKLTRSLTRLDDTAVRSGILNAHLEKHTIRIALQVISVVMWHCGESRTLPMVSKHGWKKAFEIVTDMADRLHQHSAAMFCRPRNMVTPLSPYCVEMDAAVAAFEMLLPELKRRLQSEISQCSSATGQDSEL